MTRVGESHLLIGLGHRRYGRVDVLCLDELGCLGLDRRGAELLFQVFTEREERSSVAIAGNSRVQ